MWKRISCWTINGFKNNGGDNDNIDNDAGRVIEGNSSDHSSGWQNFYNSYQNKRKSVTIYTEKKINVHNFQFCLILLIAP